MASLCPSGRTNGSQFVSDYFKKYLEENGIEHRRTKSLWPQVNGEIQKKNVVKRPRIDQAEERKWRSGMDDLLMMYCSTPH